MLPSAPRSVSRALVGASALTILFGGLAAAVDDDTAQRVDIYGDPLPDGAVARLGTVRYRACAGAGRIQFLADGRTLLGCDERRLVWLDVPTGRTVHVIETENTFFVSLLAFSKDRSLAAVSTHTLLPDEGDYVYGVMLVDTANRTVLPRLQYRGPTHRQNATAACFTPDGRHLVTGDDEGVLRVWSVETGREELANSLTRPDEVNRIDCSADGKWLAVMTSRSLFRWEWQAGRDMEPIGVPDDYLRTVEFAPEGRVIALVVDEARKIRLLDIETGGQIGELSAPGRTFRTEQLAFTPDGSRLVAASVDDRYGPTTQPRGEIEMWNVATGKLMQKLPFQHGLGRVAISPDERWIAATNAHTVSTWDLRTGESVSDEYFGHRQEFGTLAVSPDGEQVATAGNAGLVVVWDAASGRPVHTLQHGNWTMVRGVAFSPDGNLIATSSLDDTIGVWNADSGDRLHTLLGHGELGGRRALRFTLDGKRLLSFGDDWFLRVFSMETGKCVLEHAIRPSGLQLPNGIDGSVDTRDERMSFTLSTTLPNGQFTPDCETLVLGVGTDVYLFDVATGTQRARHDLRLIYDRMALSPDGMRVAVLNMEQSPVPSHRPQRAYSIRIGDLTTGEVERTIELPDRVPKFTFSPDATKLATSARVIRVYDVATGRELALIEPESDSFWGIAFTPDGERLVTSHYDTTAMIWNWRQFLIDEETER